MHNVLNLFRLCLAVALSLGMILPVAAQTATPEPPYAAESPLSPPVETGGEPGAPESVVYPPDALVDAVVASMSAADRVGQLFLITFQGSDTGFDSDIAELVYGYRVGGVILSPAKGNFSNEKGVDTPRQVASLINRLQALSYGVLLPEERAFDPLPEEWPGRENVLMQEMTNVSPLNLPLLVAVEQSGDNLPATALRRGFTPLPSQMAIGATWNPDLANRVGRIAGRELAAVGVNLLLGPNLDVLDQPRPDRVGRLGVHMFGGDPFWVGQMGRAYISGVHEGGERRVATVARNFPGAGDVDRFPEQEIPTVQRSLEELRRVVLPPFLAVTRLPAGGDPSQVDPAVTDGLMSSHVRYSGFQGTGLGRNTPIGLATELSRVLEQEGFAAWREQGGLMVSGGLGAPAIQRHYSASAGDFPFRRIALDAFTAGHDLLVLNDFSSDGSWESEKANIQETIGFFQERYVNDAGFAQRVDESVRRIVRLKLSLYAGAAAGPARQEDPALPLAAVLIKERDLAALNEETQAAALAEIGQVALESITILYPDPSGASDVFSRVPQAGEQLLIFSDSRLQRDCEACMTEAAVGPVELGEIILRLYGPEATGQLSESQIDSRTFADLAELLDAESSAPPTPAAQETDAPSTPEPLPEQAGIQSQPSVVDATGEDVPADEVELDKNARTDKLIDEADWIIFAMLDVDAEQYLYSDAVKRFLRQRSEDLATKNVVVFALNAPYFLDATEISKLNAYYGVYSKTQPFLEGAVRALFRAYAPEGAPPVSVAGTRFAGLAERLAPDPTRPLALRILAADGSLIVESGQAPESPPVIAAGDQIRLQAGPVLDYNGNPVSDGRTADFILAFEGDESAPRVESATVRNGVASRDLLMERGGLLQVTAQVGAATTGAPLAVSVQGEAIRADSTVVSETAPAGVVAEASGAAVEPANPGAEQASTSAAVEVETPAPIGPASLIIALVTIVATLSMLLIAQVRVISRRALVHSMLWAVNCGLLAYILYGLGLMPGAAWLQNSLRVWGAALVVFIAMLLPALWLQLRSE